MTSKKIATNNKTNILDAILTPQEYSQLKYKTPYILDFKKNNQEMLYIGVEHSRDPNAKQYLKIESLFEKFLKQYPSGTITIAIENFIPSAQKSKNDSIVSYGESGLLLYLVSRLSKYSSCSLESRPNIPSAFMVFDDSSSINVYYSKFILAVFYIWPHRFFCCWYRFEARLTGGVEIWGGEGKIAE